MMRQPGLFARSVGRGWSINRSRHQRKAVRVLPVPVGARMSVLSPRAMTGQPARCGEVGSSKTSRNQAAVTGWKAAKGSEAGSGTAAEGATALLWAGAGPEPDAMLAAEFSGSGAGFGLVRRVAILVSG